MPDNGIPITNGSEEITSSGSITVICNSAKDTTPTALSIEDFKLKYLYGLPLEKDGQSIPDEVFANAIATSCERVENLLNLKLARTVISEEKDFHYDDWVNWSYVKATYPVVCPLGLDGYLGTTKQAKYPRQWLTARATTDGKLYSRILYMVPAYSAALGNQNSIVVSGIIPSVNWFASYRGNGRIPCYWTLKYVTGWNKIPLEIVDVIGKIATLQIIPMLNDILQGNSNSNIAGSGLGWGLSSKSISIDGLSQSVSSTAPSEGVFGARVKQYQLELGSTDGSQGGQIKELIDFYKDINWMTA